eukprot:403374722
MVLSTIYFVRTIKNQRRHTWDSTKHEVLFIVGIVILTYALKLSIRFYFLMVDKEPYIDNILNAVQFLLSQYLPIFFWNYFKKPTDCFQPYNDMQPAHFSIFQLRSRSNNSYISSMIQLEGDEDEDDMDLIHSSSSQDNDRSCITQNQDASRFINQQQFQDKNTKDNKNYNNSQSTSSHSSYSGTNVNKSYQSKSFSQKIKK